MILDACRLFFYCHFRPIQYTKSEAFIKSVIVHVTCLWQVHPAANLNMIITVLGFSSHSRQQNKEPTEILITKAFSVNKLCVCLISPNYWAETMKINPIVAARGDYAVFQANMNWSAPFTRIVWVVCEDQWADTCTYIGSCWPPSFISSGQTRSVLLILFLIPTWRYAFEAETTNFSVS